MRNNLPGFALTMGMGLIVILLGCVGLSAAGLVGFSADTELAEQAAEADSVRQAQMAFSCQGDGRSGSTTVYVPSSPAEEIAIRNGDALFKSNCTQCHAINEKIVGPALRDIIRRRPITWLVPWVQNSAKVVASGDAYGVKLFNEYGKQQMPSFSLKKKEIEDIIAYINVEGGTSDYALSTVH